VAWLPRAPMPPVILRSFRHAHGPCNKIVPYAHHCRFPPRVYSQVSEQVMERLRQLTPLVEQISIDEAFMDVTDLPDSGEAIARRLQAIIREELGLPCSLGSPQTSYSLKPPPM